MRELTALAIIALALLLLAIGVKGTYRQAWAALRGKPVNGIDAPPGSVAIPWQIPTVQPTATNTNQPPTNTFTA